MRLGRAERGKEGREREKEGTLARGGHARNIPARISTSHTPQFQSGDDPRVRGAEVRLACKRPRSFCHSIRQLVGASLAVPPPLQCPSPPRRLLRKRRPTVRSLRACKGMPSAKRGRDEDAFRATGNGASARRGREGGEARWKRKKKERGLRTRPEGTPEGLCRRTRSGESFVAHPKGKFVRMLCRCYTCPAAIGVPQR